MLLETTYTSENGPATTVSAKSPTVVAIASAPGFWRHGQPSQSAPAIPSEIR